MFKSIDETWINSIYITGFRALYKVHTMIILA